METLSHEEFKTIEYGPGHPYRSEEIISFSNAHTTHYADVHKEMQFHNGVRHVEVRGLTQKEFDTFVKEYADRYESILFFANPQVKDVSALAYLRNVKYLLFWWCGAKHLWNMENNMSLQGLYFSDSKSMVYDLSPIANAPELEELELWSCMDRKYTVQSLEPIKKSCSLKRVILECRTENRDFEPDEFSHLEVFQYRVDKHRNFTF